MNNSSSLQNTFTKKKCRKLWREAFFSQLKTRNKPEKYKNIDENDTEITMFRHDIM